MILFGPQGNSEQFYADGNTSSWEAMKWLHDMGLNAYEYAYGRGFPVGDSELQEIGKKAREFGMHLAVMGVYFINLADAANMSRELGYFDESLRVVKELGAERLAFHPGSCGSMSRQEAFSNAMKDMKIVVEHVKASGFTDLILCPEIMDEKHDIGTLDEIIELCGIDECIYPDIDFAHLQAITNGSLKTKADYAAVLDKVKNGVGEEKYRHMHIDFAHCRWSESGERELLTFADTQWGPFFEPLAELIAERNLEPWCICDSKGTQAQDAVSMKEMYEKAKAGLDK